MEIQRKYGDMNTENNKTNSEEHPVLCDACNKHIVESNLEWVLCGGLCVGMHRQPLVWRLRDKDENGRIKKQTEDLRKLAAAMRLLVDCHKHLPEDLAGKVAKFCNMSVKH